MHGHPLDRAIARLAERQHGIVGRSQLLRLGASKRAIEYRVESGRLHPVHRGVYAVGHRLVPVEGPCMAAVLAVGPDAVASYRSAGARWAILRYGPRWVEITAARALRSRPGLRIYRAALPPDEITIVDGIPVTTVARTLLDLAAVVDFARLERALHEAEIRGLWDFASLRELLDRYPRRRGTVNLRAIIDAASLGVAVTRSELEDRFVAFIDHVGLPRPAINACVKTSDGDRLEADCVWREQRVIVELDGHAVHATTVAYERDRARDRALTAAGWRVVRVTWRQLHREADQLEADLRTVLHPARRS